MSIFDFLTEMCVVLPARDEGLVKNGCKVVLDLIEEQRRQEKIREEERQRERVLARSDDQARDKNIRFKSRLPDVPNACYPTTERRPPDLKAAALTFPARLLLYVREKCEGRGPLAYKRAGVARNVYSRIVSDDHANVDKKTAMQFCIGLQLDRCEADLLLKSGGHAFSDTIPLDRVFTYCIENKVWNILDVEEIVVNCGLPSLNLKS